MRRAPRKRHGVALVIMLVALAVLSIMLTALIWQTLAQRRFLERREHQLQAYWLVQTGFEHAAARLLAQPKDYTETLKVLPESELRIQVESLKDGAFRITSEARFPTTGQGVERSASRTYRLAKDGRGVRLELVEP